MKKFFILFAFLAALSFAAKANPVDVQQARKIGAKYLQVSIKAKVASEQDLRLAATYRTENGTAALFVFNAKEGWIVVSADDCATPILGYSEIGQFAKSNIPPAMEAYLQNFAKQIDYGIRSGLPALDTVAHQWELVRASGLLRNDRATAAAVAPLLTTNWGQGSWLPRKYNILCPYDVEGPNNHALTGCTATAMAQIMRYWRHPIQGTGSHGYTPVPHPTTQYPYQFADFESTTYDWDNMPDMLNGSSSTTENNAVATLMWHCGVALEAKYGPKGTEASESSVATALTTYFKYSSDAHFAWRSDYDSDATWISKIKGNLNKGWPVHYRGGGEDEEGPYGHMFVLDGYDADNMFHINWGWDGSDQDTYFAYGAFSPAPYEFNDGNCAVFDIHPDCETSGTRSLPYFDGFEPGETEWECCTKQDYLSSSSKWSTFAFGSNSIPSCSGKICAKRTYNSTSAGNCNDWLILPPVFLQPGRDETTLTFKTYEEYSSDYKFEGVFISTSGTDQSDFTQVWTQNNPSSSWKTVNININNYGGYKVYIAFKYSGINGHSWYIDDIGITQSWEACPSLSLPFNDNFTYNLSGCWYIIDRDQSGGRKCWKWDSETQSAYHPKAATSQQNGWLISERVFLQPGQDETKLSFKAKTTSAMPTGKKNSVWIAVDKPLGELTPSDFTKIWEDPSYSSSWQTYNIDLSAYQGHNVNIAFRYQSTILLSHNWYIDDVSITESWSPCPAWTAPYSDSFDSELSSCWYVIDQDMSGGEKCWHWDSENQCVSHPYGQQETPQVGWLFSKKVSLSSSNSYKLSFKSKSVSNGTGRRNSVWIAVDKSGTPNPSDYTEIWVDPDYNGSWTNYVIDLSAYSGHSVNIAFKYQGTYAHKWFIDDFSISEIPTYNITASASPSAGGSVSGAGTFNEGATCTLTATPNTGYHFVKWTKNGSQVSTDATYSFTVNASGSYVANFALDSYTITASANPSAGGTVSGDGSFNHGATCTLTATANSGYEFMYWKKDGTVVSSNSSYSFTVTSDGTYVAHFQTVPIGPTVTIGEGTATASDLPCHSFYNYSLTQQIYTSDEIGGATTIQRIAFYNDGETKTRNITIYMMNTSKTMFESSSDWISVTSANQVFSNDVTFTAGQWTHITLTTPFAYDGTNLALVVDDNTGSYSEGMVCRVFDTDVSQAIRAFSDSNNYDPFSPTDLGTLKTKKNQIILTTTGVSGSQLTVYPDASETNNTIPMYVYYFDDFTRAQHIIPASELTMMNGGQITAIKYYTNSDYIPYTSASEIDFYLKEVSSPTLTSFVDKSTAQIVYHGTVQFVSTDEGGEVTIYFTTPFTYNGGNLLVGCDNTTNAGYKNIKFIGETGHTNAALYGSSSIGLANVTVNPATFLPKTTFTYSPGSGGTVTQTTNFVNGWNWWSSFIELDATSLTALEEGLGSNGVTIKSQNSGYNSYMEGFGWYGTLASINNESSYQVKTSAACSVDISGSAANPTSHPITLNANGWTWIGYPVNASLSVSDALAGITAAANDMLKSQNDGYASYLEGFGWYGALSTINPGMGLMYKSNSSSSATFTYPSGGSKDELKPNQKADNNHWLPNLNAYADNMSVMAVVELDGEELSSENYELAAFANGECRGSARLLYIAPLNRYMAFLTVAGEDVTELYFGLYNTETGEELVGSDQTVNFSTNAVLGSFAEPYVVSFRGETGMYEWARSLQIFPNPVNGGELLNIGLSEENLGKVRVEIINAMGVVVETRSIASHQTVTAPEVAGVYTLRITMEGKGTCYRKLVVE